MSTVQSAEIVAIGSELLTPHRLDTNSLYLTGHLNDIGIDVRLKAVVGDSPGDLTEVIRQALSRADLIVTTGGLGPTADDLTRDVVAEVLGLPLVEDSGVMAAIRERFEKRGLRMPEANRRQALVPRGARVLPNRQGTAPGLWLEFLGRILVLLPGPPRELRPMFESSVLPILAEQSAGRRVRRRVLKIAGLPESQVEEKAHPIYAMFASGEAPIETTILAAPGQIELHLSSRGLDTSLMDQSLDRAAQALERALAPAVFSVDGRSIEAVVGSLLGAREWTIAVAESCTGGLVCGRLTEVSGSSAWVAGGVVAYSNHVKVRDVGVPEAVIAEQGAVSEPVARAMADGIRRKMSANMGVGVTGIAGPSGGTASKPVGTVVVAVAATDRETVCRTFTFPGDRATVRAHTVMAALEMVRQVLLKSDAPLSRDRS